MSDKRKIKFKARCIEHWVINGRDCYGQWVYGDYVSDYVQVYNMAGLITEAYVGVREVGEFLAVDENTFCQFTGLKIIDGRGVPREIYEGDILTSACYPFHDGEAGVDSVAVVEWNQSTVSYILFVCTKDIIYNKNARQTFWKLNETNLSMYNLVPSGNIHDDTELSHTIKYYRSGMS